MHSYLIFQKLIVKVYQGHSIALNNLLANKLRSGLTALGIVVGVLMIFIILNIINGLNKAFLNQLSIFNSDNFYISKIPLIMDLNFFEYRNRKDITLKELTAIKENTSFSLAIAPIVNTAKNIKYNNHILKDVSIIGTDYQYENVTNIFTENGRFLSVIEVEKNRNVCVLGRTIAEKLFEKKNPLSQKIYINGHPFYVIGVLEKQGESLGNNFDYAAIIPIGSFFKMSGKKHSLTIGIKTIDSKLVKDAMDEVRGILRSVRQVKFESDDDFAINNLDAFEEIYRNLTSVLYKVLFSISSFSIFIAGFGILNIMLATVLERKREIGIRMAVGGKHRDIFFHFLYEAILLSILGALVGIFTGLLVGEFINNFSTIPSCASLQSIITGITVPILIGIISGSYPAYKASRLNIIEALRSN